MRLLFSRSRKEFGDSEPFGRWLMLARVPVLTSLWTDTNKWLSQKLVESNSTHQASAVPYLRGSGPDGGRGMGGEGSDRK